MKNKDDGNIKKKKKYIEFTYVQKGGNKKKKTGVDGKSISIYIDIKYQMKNR